MTKPLVLGTKSLGRKAGLARIVTHSATVLNRVQLDYGTAIHHTVSPNCDTDIDVVLQVGSERTLSPNRPPRSAVVTGTQVVRRRDKRANTMSSLVHSNELSVARREEMLGVVYPKTETPPHLTQSPSLRVFALSALGRRSRTNSVSDAMRLGKDGVNFEYPSADIDSVLSLPDSSAIHSPKSEFGGSGGKGSFVNLKASSPRIDVDYLLQVADKIE